ncbi:MAG: SAM-dependent methyltransferase [Deinococcus sp.]|nr:SAM-dependent methyltransferase [Deinococcus sp.]
MGPVSLERLPYAAALPALAAGLVLLPRRGLLSAVAGCAILAGIAWQAPLALNLSQYKGLAGALRLPGAQVVAQRFGPLGRVEAVAAPALRHAPGLSLAFTGNLPPQQGLFFDGDGPSVVLDPTGDLSYLDYLTDALSYHLLQAPQVLVLGAGGGAGAQQALQLGARAVTALELNPDVVHIMRQELAGFSGELYSQPPVEVVLAEARGFTETATQRFDLIQLSLVDSFGAAAAGVHASSESYLYTVEAFSAFLAHLQTNGILAITRWAQHPPRDALKVFATAIQALERLGLDPAPRLAAIRSWATSTVLVKPSGLSESDLASIRTFAARRFFDLWYLPGLAEADTNRYNLVDEPVDFRAAQELLSDPEGFYRAYLFNVRPASDDRPYFFHFLKWTTLPKLLSELPGAWAPQVEWGTVLQGATLLQALAAGLLIILFPLLLVGEVRRAAGQIRTGLYFAALGLGYIALEIALIQRLTLFLAHPAYAFATALAGFLAWSGLGSRWSRRLRLSPSGAALLVTLLAIPYSLWLDNVLLPLLAAPLALKVALSLLLIAPLALVMGLPFPLGLSRLAPQPALAAWAWGVNGCASVVGAVLAALVAVSTGISTMALGAAGVYLLAAMTARGSRPQSGG